MSFGTHGYRSPLGERDALRDAIGDAIRLALPRPHALKPWIALSARKKDRWRYAADRAVSMYLGNAEVG